MELGADNDYTFSDNTGAGGVDQIVFASNPASGAKLAVFYRRTGIVA